ncbi:hypothetical protein ACOSQ3_014795 [Xanthoceras sorbifolium]
MTVGVDVIMHGVHDGTTITLENNKYRVQFEFSATKGSASTRKDPIAVVNQSEIIGGSRRGKWKHLAREEMIFDTSADQIAYRGNVL